MVQAAADEEKRRSKAVEASQPMTKRPERTPRQQVNSTRSNDNATRQRKGHAPTIQHPNVASLTNMHARNTSTQNTTETSYHPRSINKKNTYVAPASTEGPWNPEIVCEPVESQPRCKHAERRAISNKSMDGTSASPQLLPTMTDTRPLPPVRAQDPTSVRAK